VKKIENYIIHEIVKPLAVVSLIFAGLFICFSFARLLADAVTESVGYANMIKLVTLKTLIAMDVLVPLSLYVAIITGLGRLHRDQEIIIMKASGLNEASITRTVLMAVLPVAVLVGVFSISIRPWAYSLVYDINTYLYRDANFDKYQGGRFYTDEDSGQIVYLQDRDRDTGEMESVFLYRERADKTEFILARKGEQVYDANSEIPRLHLFDGFMYRLQHAGMEDSIIRFSKFVYNPADADDPGYKRKSLSTLSLIAADDPREIAEFQWRLSRPLATVILAMLAIPFSYTSPREGKSQNVFIAAIAFAIYYNLTGVAQSWVEQGMIERFPGVWWLHTIMLLVVVWLLWSGLSGKPAITR